MKWVQSYRRLISSFSRIVFFATVAAPICCFHLQGNSAQTRNPASSIPSTLQLFAQLSATEQDEFFSTELGENYFLNRVSQIASGTTVDKIDELRLILDRTFEVWKLHYAPRLTKKDYLSELLFFQIAPNSMLSENEMTAIHRLSYVVALELENHEARPLLGSLQSALNGLDQDDNFGQKARQFIGLILSDLERRNGDVVIRPQSSLKGAAKGACQSAARFFLSFR